MTGRYNAYTGNRPLKWQISVPKSNFELFGRNRFWWVTCVLSYTLWDLGVSIAPPHPSALAIEWLAVLTAPKSLSYCTTFPTLTVHMVEYMGYSTRLQLYSCSTRASCGGGGGSWRRRRAAGAGGGARRRTRARAPSHFRQRG
jgi:hypothetical protein